MAKIEKKSKVRKSKKSAKIHLTVDQIKENVAKLEKQVEQLSQPADKKKRMNCFKKLAKLQRVG
jgi:hypothetical protein